MYERSHVVLPKHIWTQATDKEDFKRRLSAYMRRYPGYIVKEVHKYYCICEIGRG